MSLYNRITELKRSMTMTEPTKLTVLWTTDNPVTAMDMVLLYSHNAFKHGWWEEVTVSIWGASVHLVKENEVIQEELKAMIAAGIKVEACIVCANRNNATEVLQELGVKVYGWGDPLTRALKGDSALLSV